MAGSRSELGQNTEEKTWGSLTLGLRLCRLEHSWRKVSYFLFTLKFWTACSLTVHGDTENTFLAPSEVLAGGFSKCEHEIVLPFFGDATAQQKRAFALAMWKAETEPAVGVCQRAPIRRPGSSCGAVRVCTRPMRKRPWPLKNDVNMLIFLFTFEHVAFS